mmetsp:Transcript_478/g.637  ORF Transcript_478/g.637 Transcript_478/m.637 type:complete len:284 (+) Transcript_478:205-1056(+)
MDGIGQFNDSSQAQTSDEIYLKRTERGECPQCGSKTFEIGRKGFLGKTKKKPLTIPNLCKEGRCLICFPTDAELLLRAAQSNYISSTAASARVDNPHAGAQIGTYPSNNTSATAPAVIQKATESALPAPVVVATSVSPSSSIPAPSPPSTFQFNTSSFGGNNMTNNAVTPSSQFDASKVGINTVEAKTFDFSNTSPPQPPSSTFKFDASKTTGNFTFGTSSPGDFTTSKPFTFGATKGIAPKLSTTIPKEVTIEEVESSPPPTTIPNQQAVRRHKSKTRTVVE